MSNRFIPPHGGYKKLLSYRKTEIIYDATVAFCSRFINKRDRTYDQMIQAARSGKQNIVEGSKMSATSKESEIKLIGVARASLEELLTDFEDYLRTQKYSIWDKDSKEALFIRQLGKKDDISYDLYKEFIETRPADVVANIIICLIHQANYLLDKQLQSLEQEFLKQGGLRERMYNARLKNRETKSPDIPQN